ncbi:hypothetical protein BDQ12DRAFT_768686 [Crucibulum laeve]|uniref:Uncharacterized protein n=1 Tax=Crucibulum laeve TaxID=68775 RepID=A0A5C3LM44_9AGAR|nr:hypothetical protein BDQ12DRAFT_768686 [Crucibulum laeve]
MPDPHSHSPSVPTTFVQKPGVHHLTYANVVTPPRTPTPTSKATTRPDTSHATKVGLQASSTASQGIIRSEHKAEMFKGGKNIKINGAKLDVISNTAGVSFDFDDGVDLDKVAVLYKIAAEAQTKGANLTAAAFEKAEEEIDLGNTESFENVAGIRFKMRTRDQRR